MKRWIFLVIIGLLSNFVIAQKNEQAKNVLLVEQQNKLTKLFNSDPQWAYNFADSMAIYYRKLDDECQAHIFEVNKVKALYVLQSKGIKEKIDSLKKINLDCGKKQGLFLGNLSIIEAWYYSDRGNLAKADSLLKFAMPTISQVGTPKIIADFKANYSSILLNMGKSNAALSLLLEISEEYDLNQDSLFAAGLFQNIGIVYKRLYQYEKSVEYYEKALDFTEKTKGVIYPTILNNLGGALMALNRFEKAESTLLESLKFLEKNKNDYTKTYALHSLASNYYLQKKYKQAEKRFLELATLEKELGFSLNLADTYTSLGMVYLDMENLTDSKKYLALSKSILDTLDKGIEWVKWNETNALANLFEVDKAAFIGLKEAIEFRQREVKEFFTSQNQELSEIFLSNQLKLEKDNLTNELILEQANLANQKKLLLLSIVFLGILALFLAFLYRFYLKQKALNLQLEQKNDQIQTLNKELNHRVKNNLSFMTSLIEMQSRRAENSEVKELLRESEQRIRTLALVHAQLFANEAGTEVNLKAYLLESTGYLKAIFSTQAKPISFETDFADTIVDAEDAMRIGLIINEAITNSIKYAFHEVESPAVKISTQTTSEGVLQIMVKDNGPGFSYNPDAVSDKPASLGLRLIELLSQQLGAQYRVSIG